MFQKNLLILGILLLVFACKKNNNTNTPSSSTPPPSSTPVTYGVMKLETSCTNSTTGSPMNITTGTYTARFFPAGFTGTAVPSAGLTYIDTFKLNGVQLPAIDTVYTYTQSSNIFIEPNISLSWLPNFPGFWTMNMTPDTVPLWKDYIYLPDSLDRNAANGFYLNIIMPSTGYTISAQITISDENVPLPGVVTQSVQLGNFTAYYPFGSLSSLSSNPQGAIIVEITENFFVTTYDIYHQFLFQRVHKYKKKIKLK